MENLQQMHCVGFVIVHPEHFASQRQNNIILSYRGVYHIPQSLTNNGQEYIVDYNGCLHSVITDPQPMGMQGPVIYPDQNRVVSIRKCARCHGFPDTYQFSGTASDKYFQIGTSTPVNVAAVLGLELAKSVAVKELKSA